MIEIENNSSGSANVRTSVQFCKRKIAKKETFLAECSELVIRQFFTAFHKAKDLFKKAMSKYPPDSRSRGFEASTFQTCIIGELQKAFPSDWKFWKYKRFALSMKGYSFLIKKLDKKEMPMNIRTKANNSILNQVQTLIFDPTVYENPIIFFGWQKSKFGELMAPHFVYIDKEKIQWRFYEEELTSVTIPTIPVPNSNDRLLPKVKERSKKKKAN